MLVEVKMMVPATSDVEVNKMACKVLDYLCESGVELIVDDIDNEYIYITLAYNGVGLALFETMEKINSYGYCTPNEVYEDLERYDLM